MKEVTAYIESYIKLTHGIDLPKGFRDRVVATLGYFKAQSLCDLDRREPERLLKQNWFNFLTMLRGTTLTETFRENRSAWSAIESFVGIPEVKATFQKMKIEKVGSMVVADAPGQLPPDPIKVDPFHEIGWLRSMKSGGSDQ